MTFDEAFYPLCDAMNQIFSPEQQGDWAKSRTNPLSEKPSWERKPARK